MKNETKITALPGRHEVTIVREFEAPRELVFNAHARPELLSQWLGPRDLKMTIDRYDFKSGGTYRYIHTRDEDHFCFHGVFHEVSPERIIQTFEFEGLQEKGHVSLDTLRLEELPGNRTRLTIHTMFQTPEDRDGMLQNGMERGVSEGYERLEELLECMQ